MRISPTAWAAWLIALGASGCALALDYPETGPEICDNTVDDDLDGRRDCADLECAGVPACREICDNGEDDDEDDLTDCADPQCDGSCVEEDELCFDERDNDLDGFVDWRDPRCWDVAASVSVDDCSSVEGGDWDMPAAIGVEWTSSARTRVQLLADGQETLVSEDGDWVELRSRSVTTGNVMGMEQRVELAFFPGTGLVGIGLSEPTADSSIVFTGAELSAGARTVETGGAWVVAVSAFSVLDLMPQELARHEVVAPTDAPLTVTLRMLPAPLSPSHTIVSTTWELSLADGTVLSTFVHERPADTGPLVSRILVSGSGGLVSARITRLAQDPCGDGPRPAPELRTIVTERRTLPGRPLADVMPDGAACAWLPSLRQWRRFPRGEDGHLADGAGELVRAVSEDEAIALVAMYLEPDTGRVHAVHEVGDELRIASAPSCGDPLTVAREALSLDGVGPALSMASIAGMASGVGGGHELLVTGTVDGAGGYYVVRSSATSPSVFAMSERLAASFGGLFAYRVGSDWVATPRDGFGYFDSAGAVELVTVGRPDGFVAISPNTTAGRWGLDGTSRTSLVMTPTPSGFEGLWLHGVYPRGRLDAQAILASQISVRVRH